MAGGAAPKEADRPGRKGEPVVVFLESACPRTGDMRQAVERAAAESGVTIHIEKELDGSELAAPMSTWIRPIVVVLQKGGAVDALCGATNDPDYNVRLVRNLLKQHGLLPGTPEILRERQQVDVAFLRRMLPVLRSWPYVDFSGLNLRNLDFSGICAGGSKFVGADLLGTSWRDAVLSGSDLCGARVDDDALRGALLFGARCPDGSPAAGEPASCKGRLTAIATDACVRTHTSVSGI